jgi:subtilase family serine protease
MLAIPILSVLLLSNTTVAAATSCNGADPAIVAALVKGVTQNGGTNIYHLGGTVSNLGNRRQTSNVLQFVDVYLNGAKVDARGIPPLRPGQSYAFGYNFQRSADAGDGTSRLRFQLDMRQPAGTGQDCNTGNDSFSLRV